MDTPSLSHTTPVTGAAPIGIGHYENFPVASLLCPAHLRPAVAALYHFARTADDLADEGDSGPEERLSTLGAYRSALDACLANANAKDGAAQPANGSRVEAWPHVFAPLQTAVRQHQLPAVLLHRLLDAFEQDVRHTAHGHHYADAEELLSYCHLSANPVGRLLLHLYGVGDDTALAESDQICSALQLINFWQDISVDLPRQRYYLPTATLQQHGLQVQNFVAALEPGATLSTEQKDRLSGAVAELCGQARALMLAGAPLVHRVPGRAGWELRLVVQGGLRVLEKIAQMRHRSWQQRPKLRAWDAPRLLWRALWM